MVIIAAFVVWEAVAGACRVLSSIVSAPPSNRSALSLVPADGVIETGLRSRGSSWTKRRPNSTQFGRVFGSEVPHGQKDGQIRSDLSVCLAVKAMIGRRSTQLLNGGIIMSPCDDSSCTKAIVWPRSQR